MRLPVILLTICLSTLVVSCQHRPGGKAATATATAPAGAATSQAAGKVIIDIPPKTNTCIIDGKPVGLDSQIALATALKEAVYGEHDDTPLRREAAIRCHDLNAAGELFPLLAAMRIAGIEKLEFLVGSKTVRYQFPGPESQIHLIGMGPPSRSDIWVSIYAPSAEHAPSQIEIDDLGYSEDVDVVTRALNAVRKACGRLPVGLIAHSAVRLTLFLEVLSRAQAADFDRITMHELPSGRNGPSSAGIVAPGDAEIPDYYKRGSKPPGARLYRTAYPGATNIVYVFPASGSMLDSFDALRMELLRSASRLSPNQQFTLIACSDKGAKLPPAARLVAATDGNKREAAEWLKQIMPSGGNDATEGIKAAFAALSKSPGAGGKVIFFANDQEFAEERALSRLIKDLNKDGVVRIHTILLYQKNLEAEASLRQIANENGGTFKFVERD